MIEQIATGTPRVVAFKLSGTLHDEDYKVFVPAVEAALHQEGKLRLLGVFDDFHGWDVHAAWDDLKFGIKHYAHFDRIALVGDQTWQKVMAYLCKPFSKASVRYFEAGEVDSAWAWLREGCS